MVKSDKNKKKGAKFYGLGFISIISWYQYLITDQWSMSLAKSRNSCIHPQHPRNLDRSSLGGECQQLLLPAAYQMTLFSISLNRFENLSRNCSLKISGLSANESSAEASLPEKTLIVEQEAPQTDVVASHEFSGGKVGEDVIPLEWLEEKVSSDFDEVEHF